MKKKFEYEYMVDSIVVNKADEISKSLVGWFNQNGYDGWELVQWNLIPPYAFLTTKITPCFGSLYILATFKKKIFV